MLANKDSGPNEAYDNVRLSKNLDWGNAELGKSSESVADLEETSTENTITIVEPWEDVGENHNHEKVRASVNVGCFAHAKEMNPRVVPLWSLRCGYPTLPAKDLASALIKYPVVFEGGAPDVFDETTFKENCPRSFLWELIKRVLLQRHNSCVQIFICVSHQLVASTLVELVKDAINVLKDLPEIDANEIGKEIERVGKLIQVVKADKDAGGGDNIVANGFEEDEFATAKMTNNEVNGLVNLYAFDQENVLCHHPEGAEGRDELKNCMRAHDDYHKDHFGVVERMIKEYNEEGKGHPKIAMFHGVEVNCEAMVFVHWALEKIFKIREKIPTESWIQDLPVGLNITSCTHRVGNSDISAHVAGGLKAKSKFLNKTATSVASMRLDYQTKKNGMEVSLNSYTCQFHPELPRSLRDARKQQMPAFKAMSNEDGLCMLGEFLEEKL